MMKRKSKALLSKNPTLDLELISKEFGKNPETDSYYITLKELTKNFTSSKRKNNFQ